jgi:hypothetical protein
MGWLEKVPGVRDIVYNLAALPRRDQLAFQGSGVAVADDGEKIVVTISGSGTGSQTPEGTTATVITCATPKRFTWAGGLNPSFTASTTGAVDNNVVTYFFPAGSISSITFSTDLDPSQSVAYTFDSSLDSYIVTFQFFATGPCFVTSMRKATDL